MFVLLLFQSAKCPVFVLLLLSIALYFVIILLHSLRTYVVSMVKYKKYLFGNAEVPRRTAYRHRKNEASTLQVESRLKPLSATEVSQDISEHTGQQVLGNEYLHGPDVQDNILVEMESGQETSPMDGNLDSTNKSGLKCDISTGDSKESTAENNSQECLGACQEESFWEKRYSHNRVCPCAVSSPEEVMVMCLSLGLRFNMSWLAQEGILKLINAMYGEDRIPASKYHYFQFIDKSVNHIKYHIVCPECEDYLGCKNDLEDVVRCVCGYEVTVSMSSTFFLSVDIAAQMKELLANDDIRDALLNYRFTRKKKSDALEDIYDGAQYQKYFSNDGILSNPFNFSYSFNTDGVPMGKSSKKSVWPLYVTINELPLKLRNKHVLLAGLYVGPKDPDQCTFLQPFVSQANQLSTEGFSWVHNNEIVISKVIPMCSCVDSQARWRMLNMSGINAYYACTFCYQKAEHVRQAGQRFPPCLETVCLRTDESTRADMQKACDARNDPDPKKRVVKGVKGPSPLSMMFFFNLIAGFVPDYMHCILLGVARLHTELIFESQRKVKFWINIESNDRMEFLIGAVDDRLLRIKSLSSITRSVRSLKQMSLWKASEWRSWLIFYSVPCLKGLLKSKHVQHLSLLSKATFMLLQKSITLAEVNEAHSLLLRYVFLFNKYFGLESMKFNVHLLTHVAQGVVNWGPLWTHSAFVYEGENRFLLQFIHSPNEVCKQIARKFIICNELPKLCAQNVKSKSVLNFCENILNRKLQHYVRCDNILLLGKPHVSEFSQNERECVAKYGVKIDDCVVYKRMLYDGIKFSCESYTRDNNHNDCFFSSSNERVMLISKIVYERTNSQVFLLVKNVLTPKRIHSDVSELSGFHIKCLSGFSTLDCLHPRSIESQCVYIDIGEEKFIVEMPYGCYGD